MAVTAGARTGITLWSLGGDPVTRAQFAASHQAVEDKMAVDVQQTLPLPAPAIRGRYLWVTDDRGGRLYRDSGVALFDLGPKPIDGPGTGFTARIAGAASANVADDVLQLRGKTGQTGNLFRITDPTGASDFQVVTAAGQLVSSAAAAGTNVWGARTAGDTVDRLAVTAGGTVGWSQGSAAADVTLGRSAGGRLQLTGTLQISGNPVVGTVSLAVQAGTGQTANVQNWRDETATNVATMTAAGVFSTAGRASIGSITAITGTPGLGVANPTAANPVIVAKGAAAQSGDGFRYTSSADAILARFSSAGDLYLTGTAAQVSLGGDAVVRRSAAGTFSIDGVLAIANPNTGAAALTSVSLLVSASASQTGNVFELRNTAGAAVLTVDPAGRAAMSTASTSATTPTLTVSSPSGIAGSGTAILARIGANELTSDALRADLNSGVTIFRCSGAGVYAYPSAVLATSAIRGFLWIPRMAGTPTGLPSTPTDASALVHDTVGSKLWVYTTAGGWKSTALT